MRIALAAAPLALLALPAAAERPAAPHAIDAQQVARLLSDPKVQDGIAQLATRFADAMLATRVGPVAALDPDAHVAPDATLGDLAARANPDYRRDMADTAHDAVAKSARALGAASAMSDELRRTADRLARVLGEVQPPR